MRQFVAWELLKFTVVALRHSAFMLWKNLAVAFIVRANCFRCENNKVEGLVLMVSTSTQNCRLVLLDLNQPDGSFFVNFKNGFWQLKDILFTFAHTICSKLIWVLCWCFSSTKKITSKNFVSSAYVWILTPLWDWMTFQIFVQLSLPSDGARLAKAFERSQKLFQSRFTECCWQKKDLCGFWFCSIRSSAEIWSVIWGP